MNERRISQRAPLKLDGAYNFPEKSDSVYNVTIINISKGGFCFLANEEIEMDTDIKLMVQITADERVTLNVRAVWSNQDETNDKYQVGVSITDSSGEDFDRFLDYYTQEVSKLFDKQ